MKKVYIVGAGIAGLTAGIFAQKSGFDVTIFEGHSIPGGFCTSWKRKGFLFEGAIHWMTGTGKDEPINKLWRATGALGGVEVLNDDPFMVCYGDWEPVMLYRDINKFREHLLDLSPQDAPRIHKLIADIRAMVELRMPLMNVKGVKTEKKGAGFTLKDAAKMLPALLRMPRLLKISCGEYAAGFAHPGIRHMLSRFTSESYYSMALVSTLATLMRGDGGYPAGGSLPMMRRMADTFERAGGRIEYNAKVEEVLRRDGRAVGVRIDGKSLECDAVIVTSDTLSAVEDLFTPPLSGGWIDEMKRTTKPMLNVFVGIGVNGKLMGMPHGLFYPLDTPLKAGGQEITDIEVFNYADYEDFAPHGCTALTCLISGDESCYDFWKRARDEGRYDQEKEEFARTIIGALEEKLPQIRGRVEVLDVATPLTYERYTGSHHGSWMSLVTPGMKQTEYPGTVEGIRGLFFAGQRQMPPGGLPVALMTGRRAAQQLCREFGVVYKGE